MKVDANENFINAPETGAANKFTKGVRTAASTASNKNAVVDVNLNPGTNMVSPKGPFKTTTSGKYQGLSGSTSITPQMAIELAKYSDVRVGFILRSELPPGLGAIQDSADGHITIYPTFDMELSHFIKLLNGIKWHPLSR